MFSQRVKGALSPFKSLNMNIKYFLVLCFTLSFTAAGTQGVADGTTIFKAGIKYPPTDSTLLGAPYLNPKLDIESRLVDLFSRLADMERAEILHGTSGWSYGAMPRIGMREFVTADGPNGLRLGGDLRATAFPSGIAYAATWNPVLIEQMGCAMGDECLATNTGVLLGPCVGIARSPLGGRNFESFGEDPFLSGKTAAAFIRGVQSKGVATSLKHWVLNDQEWGRTVINVDLTERALREIYVKPYEIAIKEANPWSVMNSYNKIRGQYSSHNRPLNDILRVDFAYDGALFSDWGGWHGDIAAINGGGTLEMPSSKSASKDSAYLKALSDGKISREDFDEAVRRNLRFALRVGAFDPLPEGAINTKEHQDICKRVAVESIVLLKNEKKTLPLNRAKIKKIAIIGPAADQWHSMADGSKMSERGGAGALRGPYEITPLRAIVDLFGAQNILYAPIYRFEKPRVKSCPELIEMDPLQAAREADVVIFFGGTDHSYDRERQGWGVLPGADKPDLLQKPGPEPGDNPEQWIRRIAQVNPRTIVVLINGAPIDVEQWQAYVPSILEAWYPGQDGGGAIVDILMGEANPSGKLPYTYGKNLNDWLSHQLGVSSYPGRLHEPASKSWPEQFYADNIWVGYRYFDRANIEPRYPFGHGLSYTSFKIEPVAGGVQDSLFTVRVTNIGGREGAEVVQCYLSKPSEKVIMPERELVGFEKVNLRPGESRVVSFAISDNEKRYWDETLHGWSIASGTYRVSIGNSSRNLPVNYVFEQK